jgi:hypothetical protein
LTHDWTHRRMDKMDVTDYDGPWLKVPAIQCLRIQRCAIPTNNREPFLVIITRLTASTTISFLDRISIFAQLLQQSTWRTSHLVKSKKRSISF